MDKIFFCTGTGDLNQWCGVSQSTFLVGSNIDESIFNVEFVTCGPYGIARKASQENYTVHQLDFDSSIISRFGKVGVFSKVIILIKVFWCNLRVFFLFLRERPRLIYCATLVSAFLYIFPAMILGIKVVLAIRGEPSNAWYWGVFYKRSDLIFPLSEDLRKLVLGHPVSKEVDLDKKVVVISNGINIPENIEKNRLDVKISLLYIGVFDERKGQLDFLKNVTPFLKGNATLQFAGSAKRMEDKAYEEECHLVAKELSNINIQFLGFVADIDNLYRNADIVLLASKSEGQPRSVIEGMAYSRPVVCYQVTSVRALLEDNNAGYVVDNGDARIMAAKINQLIENRELRLKMGQNGREFVENNLAIRAISDIHECGFQKILR